jgi:hypothetical protein
MVGGLCRGIRKASAIRRSPFLTAASRFFARHTVLIALVLAITVLYRVADVVGSPLAGESGYAFAALLPAVTLQRASIVRLKLVAPQAAPQEFLLPALAPGPALS